MFDKLVRLLNILGFVLGSGKYSQSVLADIFECEELTIKRDIQSLRDLGLVFKIPPPTLSPHSP